jgi:hypothetical protein
MNLITCGHCNLRLRSEYHGHKTLCFKALLGSSYRTKTPSAQAYSAGFCAGLTVPPWSESRDAGGIQHHKLGRRILYTRDGLLAAPDAYKES